ncbi:MAG TPA: preprotein translocase subunit SecE [Steroidobacteraceae bacterium]|jgi:preprotein translocase subunit SecE|nr:preprotein translocase subunit SecE [Steroidobacteraceae bacterium]
MTEEIKLQEVGTADQVKLGVAIAAVIAGVVGYYVLGSDATWLRWVAVGAGLVVAALLLAFSYYGSEFREFVASARVELRKIIWPSRQETGMTTLIVFVFVAIAGFFFWGLDLLLAWATRALTGQGG